MKPWNYPDWPGETPLIRAHRIFDAEAIYCGEVGCFVVARSPAHNGYPTFRFNGKLHQFSTVFAQAAPNQVARHLCGNAACVNPNHIVAGSRRQNMMDKWRHGTARTERPNLKGSKHFNTSLTEADVLEIKDRAFEGQKLSDIGKAFGITKNAVSLIVRGKNWSHLGMGPRERAYWQEEMNSRRAKLGLQPLR